MVNKPLFRAALARAEHNQVSLSKALGMTENTLSAKINNRRSFNTKEIDRICEALKINDIVEKANIFLFDTSHNRDNNELGGERP